MAVAHASFPQLRVDQCFPGLLAAHNLTETSSINAAVEAWSQAARNVAPKHCFMEVDNTSAAGVYADLVSHEHRFVFHLNAKAGSNTLILWFMCALGAVKAVNPVPADYLRVSSTRNPWTRTASGYGQVLIQIQRELNGRPSAEVRRCVSEEDLPGCTWGDVNAMPLGRLRQNIPSVADLVERLASSSFYKENHPFTGSAAEFANMLRLSAQNNVLGCGGDWFVGEHLTPQWMHFAGLGRVDFVFRVEHMEDDQRRFLEVLRRRGSTLSDRCWSAVRPKCRKEMCQIGSQGNDVGAKLKALVTGGSILSRDGEDMMDSVGATSAKSIAKEADSSANDGLALLQRLMCALYLPDMLCNGYELPEHCSLGNASARFPWLEPTMRTLTGSSSLAFLSPPKKPVSKRTVLYNNRSRQRTCSCSVATVVDGTCTCAVARNGVVHTSRPYLRLDRCIPGQLTAHEHKQPQQECSDSLVPWLGAAMSTFPSCFRQSRPGESMNVRRVGTLVSHKHRFVFRDVRNAGSPRLSHWLQCALGAEPTAGAPADPDYLWIASARDPWTRALSAFDKLTTRLLRDLDGKNPAAVYACADGREPSSGCSWGNVNRLSIGNLSLQFPATAERVSNLASTRFYGTLVDEGQRNASTPPSEEALRAFLWAAARHTLGCGGNSWFGDEMASPQWSDLAFLGRVDFLFRFEHEADDMRKFLKKLGVNEAPCSNAHKGCSPNACLVEEPVTTQIPAYRRREMLVERVLGFSDELKRLVCVTYLPDYICNGYALPEGCAASANGSAKHDYYRQAMQSLLAVPWAKRTPNEAARVKETPLTAASIGVVTVDTRPAHLGVFLWKRYAAAHNYTYIQLHPGGVQAKARRKPGLPEPVLLQDWSVTSRLRVTLQSDKYARLSYFVYVELDQWMVKPLAPLEPLFVNAGLTKPKTMMAVSASFGCAAQDFSLGVILYKRHKMTLKILDAWSKSRMHSGPWAPEWPARQGAFWRDPEVYHTFREEINATVSDCPLGAPFSPVLAHAQGNGTVPGVYDAARARTVQAKLIEPCVLDALATGVARTCALHPPWVGGTCLRCTRTLELRRPDGSVHRFNATQCCGEVDSALPVAKFRELAAIFEAREPERIIRALVDVYEGKAPVASYSLGMHLLLPELASPMPSAWAVGSEVMQDTAAMRSGATATPAPGDCHASGICDMAPGCEEQMERVAELPITEPNQFRDYATCLNRSALEVEWRRADPGYAAPTFYPHGSTSALNAYCAGDNCARLARMCRDAEQKEALRLNIGIVTVDDRKIHPGVEMWTKYCNKRGYTFIQVFPVAKSARQGCNPIMVADWNANNRLIATLRDKAYAHIDYFMYTELDQWMVQPSARLDPLFRESGLTQKRPGGRVMAVVEEYPCRDARLGGVFNMGTYLFKRDPIMERILQTWANSSHHGGEWCPAWPARQGAFSHDPLVYEGFRQHIHVLKSGCPLGAPYGLISAHTLGGFIVGGYDPDLARQMQAKLIEPCVLDALATGVARTCALHPPWVGGTCLRCTRTLELRRPDGSVHRFNATQCCGEVDSALPVAKFRELAAIFEAREPERIIRALVDVYEGKAPVAAYPIGGGFR